MPNSYQPPAFDSKHFQDQAAFPPGAPQNYSNWVGHIRTFAILNLVQGLMEATLGLGLTGLGVLFPIIGRMEEVKKAQLEQGTNPEQMFWAIAAIYLTMGLMALVSGILRTVAGVQNYRLRGRTLGLVSIIVGVAPIFTGICAPTSIAILVFGLIIYLDPAVKSAFDLVKQGRTAAQVLAMFNPHQASYPAPPQPPPA